MEENIFMLYNLYLEYKKNPYNFRLKLQWDTSSQMHYNGYLQKNLITTVVSKDEKSETLHSVAGIKKWFKQLENNLAVLQKVTHRVIIVVQ